MLFSRKIVVYHSSFHPSRSNFLWYRERGELKIAKKGRPYPFNSRCVGGQCIDHPEIAEKELGDTTLKR